MEKIDSTFSMAASSCPYFQSEKWETRVVKPCIRYDVTAFDFIAKMNSALLLPSSILRWH